MKKALLLCGLLLSLRTSPLHAAQGLNLRWDACLGDGGAQNKNFACDTNTGSRSLRGSFVLGSDLARVSGIVPIVDLATASPVLPEWWEFKNAGACRQLSLSISAFDGVTCADWAVGKASMNIAAYEPGIPAPNAARILLLNAVQLAAVMDLVANQEYTAFSLQISNFNTLNSPCTGCSVPACLIFTSCTVSTTDLTEVFIYGPADLTATSFWATWQGGGGVTVPGRPPGCPLATPVRNAT